jgi:hypothetical protein
MLGAREPPKWSGQLREFALDLVLDPPTDPHARRLGSGASLAFGGQERLIWGSLQPCARSAVPHSTDNVGERQGS